MPKIQWPVMYNDKEVRSLSHATELFPHLTYQQLNHRLRKGYTCDEEVPERIGKKKGMWWEGVYYETISQCVQQTDLSLCQAQWRSKNGYTSDADMPRTNKYMVEGDDTIYYTQEEAGLAHFVSQSTFRNWLKAGKAWKVR